MSLTPHMMSMLRNALGLPNDNNRSYRKFFAAAGDTDPAWATMVLWGYARKCQANSFGGHNYIVTKKGADAALEPGEKLCPEDFPEVTHG